MLRRIIEIDAEKCNGCGGCAAACHEGAIAMIDGKAALMRDDYCDGLGDCLPACPVDAIHFVERETLAYDAAAVLEHQKKKQEDPKKQEKPLACGCPGTLSKSMKRRETAAAESENRVLNSEPVSELTQWPVQIKLAPLTAPYFQNAKLLIAADCTAYAYGDFHRKFIRSHVTLIGCPKLDEGDYTEKLTQIIAQNEIAGVTVVRMEVPCCGGIEQAVKNALKASGKMIPWQVEVISTDGRILE